MPPLPTVSGKEVVSVLEKSGWVVVRQRGSHIIMVKQNSLTTLSIPNHKTIAKGTLRSLIRSAEMTVQEFVNQM